MSPLFGKQAAMLFLKEEYNALEKKRAEFDDYCSRREKSISSRHEQLLSELHDRELRLSQQQSEHQELLNRQRSMMMSDVEKYKSREYARIQEKRKQVEHEWELAVQAEDYAKKIDQRVKEERSIIQKCADDVLKTAPYASEIISDCIHAYDLLIAEMLEKKQRPALKAADMIRQYSHAKRSAEQQLRLLKYRLSVFEHFFPWVNEYDDLSIADLKQISILDSDDESSDDPIKQYVSSTEYMTLTDTQRNQLALDRYLTSHKKTKWQIGRDYELYIAHLFRSDGYHVQDTGSLFRFDDLGRDVIVRKNNHVAIIQCKYWSQEKEIHEKHMFQLFGTSMCYQVDHPNESVSCILVTNTKCSARAKSFAKKMNVIVKEGIELGDFPRIKCNISDDGERIYHLPMDQQYDNVVIDKPGEFFAMTVQEAVDKGFRRAYRWHGT